MFVQVIKDAFRKWWDKMGYAFLNSIFGAINPLFLGLTVFAFYLLMPEWNQIEDWSVALPLMMPYVPIVVAAMLMSPVFPTTFGVFVIQKRVIEYETIYFRRYFPDYFIGIWKSLPISLLMMFVFGLIGFVLGYSGIFYMDMISNIYIKFIVLLLHIWVIIFIRMFQFIFIPLIVYNLRKLQFKTKAQLRDEEDAYAPKEEIEEEMGLNMKEAVRLSFKIMLGEGFNILGIMLLNTVLIVVLTLSRALSVFFYYGVTVNLRIYLHKAIVNKYSPKEEKNEYDNDYYTRSTEAWARMMGKIDELEAKKKREKENS